MDYPVLDAAATGARIKELRVANHLRVEDIARFMGFESEQAVYKWQRGESLPTVDNLYALSFLLGTTVDDILRGKKEKSESPSLPLFVRTFFLPEKNCCDNRYNKHDRNYENCRTQGDICCYFIGNRSVKV